MIEDNWYEKFEQYLDGTMNREEKLLLENALSHDVELASAFKVYKAIETHIGYNEQEAALKSTLQELNIEYFQSESQPSRFFKSRAQIFFTYLSELLESRAQKILAYFTAHALSIAGRDAPKWVYSKPQLLADNYFNENLRELSQPIGSVTKSLQPGITSYNNQEYKQALSYFQEAYYNHPDNYEAKKYLGIVYLATKDYDKALQVFGELGNIKGLYTNPGLFLKAVTLMRRNQKEDLKNAKNLLQQIVHEKTEESRVAEEWLKNI